ncbi:16S rRNA (guanine(527)-N(7))-methyltransferase RsmG [Lacisediminimonas sp.]|uniref:16S rRNA (guanine(527)-N(7))-methyltransferase RsmG n=1 Tax=Lacisediminimonas sp. TaxID=3060582 RepID=UPI00271F9E8E|nr:16S rRNA (guanine(527)-N(7))-methyltransferase RsmG [Lacisediminimonas sp.]MDO8298402.1 16S rRNA (guanine(527)-N(7))-methyltransferase RsmG [Lacisediminimonas sp.]MDO9217298.1 16S rRNA (guanine(527)-N(7))-methyltransferase RsmG [Lacisediminimonas sp.]
MRGPGFDRSALAAQLESGVAALGLDLGQAGLDQLLDYTALLFKWNSVYNLTAVREPERMITQHLLDSLAAVPAIAKATRLLDVGAGGGLPGMVFAIWAVRAAPAMRITMVDTVHKKTAFLTQAKAELSLSNVTVITGRVEQMDAGEKFDVIVSRAFAELRDFVNWSGHLLQQGGRFIAMKGVLPSAEIASLPAGWAATKVEKLIVPGLDAERHLVTIERSAAGATQ